MRKRWGLFVFGPEIRSGGTNMGTRFSSTRMWGRGYPDRPPTLALASPLYPEPSLASPSLSAHSLHR